MAPVPAADRRFSDCRQPLNLGNLTRLFSRPVVTGLVDPLAILIFLAQRPESFGCGPVVHGMTTIDLAIICLLPQQTKAVPSP
jgi:SulP family sulfate permease